MTRRGFTLIEALVVVAIVALLVGLLAPSLGAARDAARGARSVVNTRQLVTAWTLYAGDWDEMAMPLAYVEPPEAAPGADLRYWFGGDGRATGRIDRAAGFVAAYLGESGGEQGVFECPAQRFGTYQPQTATGQPTTTYGYNGYGLSPPTTPGWGGRFGPIGRQPWLRLTDLSAPSKALVFADTLLPVGRLGRSTALLDPPELFDGVRRWEANPAPTTAFRHGGASAAAARADGSSALVPAQPGWIVDARLGVGSIGTRAGGAYVPEIGRWRQAAPTMP